MKITGTIYSGRGRCTELCKKGFYNRKVMGFELYPGSLNITVAPGVVAEISRQFKTIALKYHSPSEFPILLWRCRVGDVIGMAMWPQAAEKKPVEQADSLEIFAPVNLREKLGLKNGGKIEIEVENRYLSKGGFFRKTEKHIEEAHWGTAKKRWEYHLKAIEILQKIPAVKSVLEAGTMGVKLWEYSDTIDLNLPPKWPLYYEPTYDYDLTKLPWDVIKDKQYDVFVGMRVFHHVTDHAASFAEMKRIAGHIILSFPEDTAKIYRTLREPTQEVICKDTKTTILYWKVDDER